MNIDSFKKLFSLVPERYPSNLASQYPRILNQILANWESPAEQDVYLNELVVDKRGNRQGFPPKVLAEILFIAELYARWKQDRRRKADDKRLKELSPKLLLEIETKQSPLTPELKKILQQLKMQITKHDVSAMDILIKNKLYPNQRDIDGQTPLMYAASAGAEQIALSLIKLDANPHMSDITGNTALHWAVAMNRLRLVEILLYFGANPDAKNKAGATPFSLSVIKSDSAIARRLLDYGADLFNMDNLGNTPLHKAVSAKAKESVWILLKSGADKDLRNKEGVSPIDLAEMDQEMKSVFERYRSDLMRSSIGEKNL